MQEERGGYSDKRILKFFLQEQNWNRLLFKALLNFPTPEYIWDFLRVASVDADYLIKLKNLKGD